MEAIKPIFRILYDNKDITEDVSKSLISLSYNDAINEADTIDIELEDKDLLWQNEWYPEKGATLEVMIDSISCGKFEIDEIESKGPPDTILIRGISAGFGKNKTRTNNSHTHESKTLSEIVRTIARNAGLTVQGNIANIKINRSVQRKESDIRYLRKLARDYGYAMSIRDKTLNFNPLKELENRKHSVIIYKSDIINYSFNDKSTGTYKGVKISYHNSETGETVTHTSETSEAINSVDVLELKAAVDSKAQAIELTKATLNTLNKLQQTGRIAMIGNAYAIAGNVIRLVEFGKMSGDYLIRNSSHTITASDGWICDLELYKVGYVDDSLKKPSTKKTAKNKKTSNTPTAMAGGDKGLFNY